MEVATKEHEQKGVMGAVGGVLRQIPPTIVQPLIIVPEATSNVLGGLRSQLKPDARKEDEEKWKEELVDWIFNDFNSFPIIPMSGQGIQKIYILAHL